MAKGNRYSAEETGDAVRYHLNYDWPDLHQVVFARRMNEENVP